MNNDNPAAQMARLRWKGFNKKERSEEMAKVANKGWVTRRKNLTSKRTQSIVSKGDN